MDPLTAVLLAGLFVGFMNSLHEPKCQINTSPTAPLIVTTNGSQTILSGYSGLIERNKSEEIQFYCGTGFIFKNDGQYQFVSDHRLETLICQPDGSFLLKNHGLNIQGDKRSVQCRNGVAALFESRISLPNCKDQWTLILGYDFQEMGSIKSVAMCYDSTKANLKYLTYTTYPERQRVLEKTHLGELNNLGLDLRVDPSERLFKMASQADVNAFWSKEKALSQMFGTGPFDYASLVQDKALGAQVAGYEAMMSVVWLHSLRTGNWRHWLAALRSASESGDQFEVRLGVSGSIELLDGRELAIDLADGNTLSVPAHIWAHVRALQPTGASEDEFVLVGHNSPFLRIDPSAELCPSMCDQVSWLKDTLFASLHRYPINGLMLCCRVMDVAQKLDSFYGSPAQATGTTENLKALEQ
nr:uncharacterized protein LOC108018955 [Drosophila suzukii]